MLRRAWQTSRKKQTGHLVGEEEGEVGGEDAVLHVAQHLLVLVRVQFGEDVVMLLAGMEGLVSTCCRMLMVMLKWWFSMVEVE